MDKINLDNNKRTGKIEIGWHPEFNTACIIRGEAGWRIEDLQISLEIVFARIRRRKGNVFLVFDTSKSGFLPQIGSIQGIINYISKSLPENIEETLVIVDDIHGLSGKVFDSLVGLFTAAYRLRSPKVFGNDTDLEHYLAGKDLNPTISLRFPTASARI